jgi:hypothetical protein
MVAEHTLKTSPAAASSTSPFVWYAALAVTSAMVGAQWDISWHRSIGRDTFWTPAHMAIYLCGVVAGLSSAWLILGATFSRTHDGVTMWGFRGPLGAFVAAWGGVAMLTSAPFDNWWHDTYGLDVKILSPPHTVLALGINAIILGALVLTLAERNRAEGRARQRLDGIVLYMGGVMLVLFMTFLMEETARVAMHSAHFYWVIAALVPAALSGMARASSRRFAMTAVAGVYTTVLLGLIWILPLFPAEPKLGPVYQPVHCFIPPEFPVLLIAPSLVLDLLRPRTSRLGAWARSAAEGALFVAVLVVVQWPFATFLLSTASMNRVFGTIYFDFYTSSHSYELRRIFYHYEKSTLELALGFGLALGFATLGTRLGLAWGSAVSRIRR